MEISCPQINVVLRSTKDTEGSTTPNTPISNKNNKRKLSKNKINKIESTMLYTNPLTEI